MIGLILVIIAIGGIALTAVVIFTMYATRKKSLKEELVIANHKSHNCFTYEVRELLENLTSVEIKERFFEEQDHDSSVYKSFDLVKKAILQNTEKAIKYIYSYDYVAKPDTWYIKNIMDQNDKFVKKLNILSDLVLSINDSTSDIDASFADDMLSELMNMLKSDE